MNKDFNELTNKLYLDMVDASGKIKLYKKNFVLKEEILSLIENVKDLICMSYQLEGENND